MLPIVGALLAITLFWPYARTMFGFGALDFLALVVPPVAGGLVLVALEGLKPLWLMAFRGAPTSIAKRVPDGV